MHTNKHFIDTKLLHIDSRLAESDAAQLESKIRVLELTIQPNVSQITYLELRFNESMMSKKFLDFSMNSCVQ